MWILSKGGFVTFSIENPLNCYDNNQFDNYIEFLCDSKKCEVMAGYPTKDPKPIYLGKDGFFYALKVL